MRLLRQGYIFLVLLIVAGCTGLRANKSAKQSFHGKWDYVVTDPAGDPYAGVLTLVENENGLSGSLSNEAFPESLKITDVQQKEQTIAFAVNTGSLGMTEVVLELMEGSLVGTFDVEALGELPFSGLRIPNADPVKEDLADAVDVALTGNPDEAAIVTSDIDLFWKSYDKAGPMLEPEAFQDYLQGGSTGVKGYIPHRIRNALVLRETVKKYQDYYTSIREQTLRVSEMEPAIRESFHRFKSMYPDAVFPATYIVMGALNSGGTVSNNALIIGADMFGKHPDAQMDELTDWHKEVIKTNAEIHRTVAHELIHFQQRYPSGTLLEHALKEGSADFLAELIADGHLNDHVHAYADAREEELWNEFKERMEGDDYSGWLYGGLAGGDRPADLGYWMGYKITRAYYEQAADKTAAIYDILHIEDAEQFLKDSGYGEQE